MSVFKICCFYQRYQSMLKRRLWNVGRGSIACTICFGQIRFCALWAMCSPGWSVCISARAYGQQFQKQKLKPSHECRHFHRSPENPFIAILQFGHLKRLFRDGPQISQLDSQIVNTSQVTAEDLCVQQTGVGVGRGPCEGVPKHQFCGQRGPIWKIQDLREMAFHVLRTLRTAFFRIKSPFGG